MNAARPSPVVLGITGASGAVYARRLLEVLLALGRDVHLVISPSAKLVFQEELGLTLNLDRGDPAECLGALLAGTSVDPAAGHVSPPGFAPAAAHHGPVGVVRMHHHQDFMAPVASGSFLTSGMVICPCSGGTLSGVVHAASGNLIQRAADVHLKERRKLILVPRETPLSIPQLDNLKRAAEAGAVVLPAMPGWYHGVRTLQDLVDFIVARILDQLGVEHRLMKRWGTPTRDGAGDAAGGDAC
ncbi:MAG: flavin prenyltransferase UbiX [Pirellulales bacterium]